MEGTGYNYGYGYRRRNSMATASLVFGIIGLVCVVSLQFILFGIVFGSLGIMFALLSKGGDYRMTGRAVGGSVTSGIALAAALFLIIFSLWFAISVFGLETVMDPEALTEALESFYEQYNDLIDSMTGGVSL